MKSIKHSAGHKLRVICKNLCPQPQNEYFCMQMRFGIFTLYPHPSRHAINGN